MLRIYVHCACVRVLLGIGWCLVWIREHCLVSDKSLWAERAISLNHKPQTQLGGLRGDPLSEDVGLKSGKKGEGEWLEKELYPRPRTLILYISSHSSLQNLIKFTSPFQPQFSFQRPWGSTPATYGLVMTDAREHKASSCRAYGNLIMSLDGQQDL